MGRRSLGLASRFSTVWPMLSSFLLYGALWLRFRLGGMQGAMPCPSAWCGFCCCPVPCRSSTPSHLADASAAQQHSSTGEVAALPCAQAARTGHRPQVACCWLFPTAPATRLGEEGLDALKLALTEPEQAGHPPSSRSCLGTPSLPRGLPRFMGPEPGTRTQPTAERCPEGGFRSVASVAGSAAASGASRRGPG